MNVKDGTSLLLADIFIGDVFIFEKNTYIKVGSKFDFATKAVNLRTGTLSSFNDTIKVVWFPDAEIILGAPHVEKSE